MRIKLNATNTGLRLGSLLFNVFTLCFLRKESLSDEILKQDKETMVSLDVIHTNENSEYSNGQVFE